MRLGVPGRLAAAGLATVTVAILGHHGVVALQPESMSQQLDRYRAGDFDAAVRAVASIDDSNAFRTTFIQTADAWIGREPVDVPARRLAATALAVEAAHARLTHDALSHIVLLDWAARLWRTGPPSEAERVWLLTAVALVERGAHPGHFFPPPSVPAGWGWGQGFVESAAKRFPDEPRFQLSRAQWLLSTRVAGDLKNLARQPTVRADALVALAFLELSDRDCAGTMGLARQATELAVEPHTQYMAHFMIGFCHEAQGRLQEAVREYVAALRAVPRAQSASIALAALLLRDDQADAAFDLIDQSLAERPEGDDPWRLFYYGGYVRWPLLIAELRRGIR